jgi:hypothetical protein
VKAVHGMRFCKEDTGEEDDATTRRESMVQVCSYLNLMLCMSDSVHEVTYADHQSCCLSQFEALLMSLLSGHPNIVETYKCLSTWRDMSHEVVSELVAACNKFQVMQCIASMLS